MIPRRARLFGAYSGEWMDLRPDVPLAIYEEAGSGQLIKQAQLLAFAVSGWSFPVPVPATAEEALELCPWDLIESILPLYFQAFQITEEEDIALWKNRYDDAGRAIQEAVKASTCDRLNIPFAPSYEEIHAGAMLRLRSWWAAEARHKED